MLKNNDINLKEIYKKQLEEDFIEFEKNNLNLGYLEKREGFYIKKIKHFASAYNHKLISKSDYNKYRNILENEYLFIK